MIDTEEKLIKSFEKCFGKRPDDGSYEFTYLGYTFGWRAIVFRWSCKGVGFGEFALQFLGEEGIQIDNECMDDAFTIALLNEAVKRIDAGQVAIAQKKLNPLEWVWMKFKADVLKDRNARYVLYACNGYKDIESDEGHEQFIKNVCLTFKHYTEKGMEVQKATI